MGGELTTSWYITSTLTRYEEKNARSSGYFFFLLYHHVTYSCKRRGIYHFLGITSTLPTVFTIEGGENISYQSLSLLADRFFYPEGGQSILSAIRQSSLLHPLDTK